jgi:DNA-binding NarL/FixJ family response regulator
MRLFRFKRKRLNLGGAPSPTINIDELLKRHQKQDSDELRGDPLEAERRLIVTLISMSEADQLTWEIYVAARSGYTYPEIAEKWGVTVFTVKKCVAHALLEIMKR